MKNPVSSLEGEPQQIARRDFLCLSGQGLMISPFLTGLAGAAAEESFQPLNRYPRMVHDYFLEQCRAVARRRSEELGTLKTREDAEKYVETIRSRIRKCFGPEPERTPLNARVTRVTDRDGYRIENVIFESRPGFYVTANLYVPTNRTGPMPGVVGSCGHSSNGKASTAYQEFALGLVHLGYVCLVFDPIGQGERLQYLNNDLKSTAGAGVGEHLLAGNQQHIVGESFWKWRAWDGIRALDYLLTRSEVDPRHVGITGNSGGGTMTTWLCGLDPRWTMGAPGCFVTTFLRNLENELPTDPEQCPPLALAQGLDHSDFLAAMAPRPVIILAKERDFFDVRGAEEAYARLRRLYSLLDAEENVALFVGPTGHGYSQENREAMYSWFQRSTGRTAAPTSSGSAPGFDGRMECATEVPFQPEPTLKPEKDALLQCTSTGQVAGLENAKTVFDFTREKASELGRNRKTLRGKGLQEAVTQCLNLSPRPKEPPEYNIWRELRSRDYPMSAIGHAVETEPGIQAVVYRLQRFGWTAGPPKSNTKALLYIAHHSSDQELRDEPLLKELIAQDTTSTVFTCDVRGIGDSWPSTVRGGSFTEKYGADYLYATQSLMLGRPYLGQRVFDVLRVLDWITQFGHEQVHLVGKGWGALPATFTALLSDVVKQVTLKNALRSYSDVAATQYYAWPLSAMLPGVLSQFDLPDCYSELESKQLRIIEPLCGASE